MHSNSMLHKIYILRLIVLVASHSLKPQKSSFLIKLNIFNA